MPLKQFIFDRYTEYHDWAWAGGFSYCHSDGTIVRTMKTYIQGLDPALTLVLTMADGYSSNPDQSIALKSPDEFERCIPGDNTIVGILCTRAFADPRAVLMPLDDETFGRGVCDVVSSRGTLPAWEERKPIAFWRGCLSGGVAPTPRTRTVWELYDFPHADAKLTRDQCMDAAHMGRLVYPQDTRFYDESRGLDVHVQHKYILIIDGNCIASAQQWVFASGSVPVMITHPDNDWWFRKYLKPMVHYVPIQYDLSDLKEKIEWLVMNDDKAKEIATNAMEFARTVLSAEFQHGYLFREIQRAASAYANSPAR